MFNQEVVERHQYDSPRVEREELQPMDNYKFARRWFFDDIILIIKPFIFNLMRE